MLILPCLALLLSLVSLLIAVAFWQALKRPQVHKAGCVTLLLPLTGPAHGLERLLQALAQQTLQPRRLLISIQDRTDPAFARATALSAKTSFPINFSIEVVLAGAATHCAQKCWNQIAALRHLDDQDAALVLLDADIMPPPPLALSASLPTV